MKPQPSAAKRTKWSWSEKILFLTPGLFLGFVAVSVYGSRASRSIEAFCETIGIPTRNFPRRVSCQSNFKQIGLGFMQYVRDYDERWPLATNGGQNYGWADSIQPHLKSTQLYHCPQNSVVVSTNPTRPGYTDYFYNARLSRTSMAETDFPALTVMAGEGTPSDARYAKRAFPPAWTQAPRSPARLHYAHRSAVIGGSNVLFNDGHVKWMEPQHVGTAPASTGNFTFALR